MSNLLHLWQFNWLAFGFMLLLCLLYLIYHRFTGGRWIVPFTAAIFVMVICFFSPLSILSEQYLFSAHMAVHVLLLLVAGPLLVAGMEKKWHQKKMLAFSNYIFHHPVVGWLAGVGMMWIWHLPFIFNYAMELSHQAGWGNFIHVVESTSLLLAGMLFSRPFISPVKQNRISPLHTVVYLFTACIGCSLLGLLITFSGSGIYHHFLSATDSFGLNEVILNKWNMNQVIDQQVAGLIMWVPCCFLYVIYSLYILVHWLNGKEALHTA